MKEHKYSIFARLIYRYANFPLTLFLLIYLILTAASININLYYSIPLIINAAMIYFLNRHYIRSYKTMPYLIRIDNDKIICSNFLIGRKEVTIKIDEIEDIKGGIFSGHLTKPIFIYFKGDNLPVSINSHISGYNELLTVILQNVKVELYKRLLEQIKEMNENFKSKRQIKKPAQSGHK